MKNFIQAGDTIPVVAPANVLSGAPVLVGSIFGVATADALSGADVQIQLSGVFDLPKLAGTAWTQGALLYWNGTAVTVVVSTNKLIGVAVRAEGSALTTGRVRLTGASAN